MSTSKVFGRLRGRRALAWIKHRQWWMRHVNPPGPALVRITEDSRRRITEDGRLRVTESAT